MVYLYIKGEIIFFLSIKLKSFILYQINYFINLMDIFLMEFINMIYQI